MLNLINSHIGRLRIIGFLEGVSFILLVFVGMPLKYWLDSPWLVKNVGMAHGILFMLFVLYTIITSIDQKWNFFKITWKVLLSSILPFGTFYVDAKILKPLNELED